MKLRPDMTNPIAEDLDTVDVTGGRCDGRTAAGALRSRPRGRLRFPVLLLAIAFTWLSAVPATQVRDWPSERPPRPLPAPEVNFPPYEVRTLPNGLQVVAVLQHEQPAVSMRMLVRAGAVLDPEDKPGVASLAAALLDQGTTTRSAEEIADTIDTIGGGLGTGSGRDLTFANVIVIKDSFNLALELLSDIVRNPAFAPEEIDRQRQQMLSSLTVSYDDADYLASAVFARLVYGLHPYGRPASGTPESLSRITREDLVAFHRASFAPNNAILAIVGDVTAEEAFSGAERVFGDWARRELLELSTAEPPEPTRRVVVVDRPGAVQTEIRVGHLGVPRKHPDNMALDLAIRILGGEGSNRLHRVLRSERGLTYGAAAEMEAMKHTGSFYAETDTRSEATGEALRLIVDEFWRLQRERVHPRELADAQAYMTGSFPLTIETPDAIALQVLNALFFELDLEELETYRERVNAVTVDDIQRVAARYLRPDRLSIVLVGDASVFEGQLRGAGFSRYERVPIGELDLTASDFLRPLPEQGAPAAGAPQADSRPVPGPEEIRVAQEILGRAIEAKGGLDLLRSVRTVVAAANTTLTTPAGPVHADTVTYIEYPDRFRVEAVLPSGRLTQTYARGEAWIESPAGVQGAPADEFRSSVNRDLIPLLVRAAGGELQIRPLPEEAAADGTRLLGVEVWSGDLDPVGVYIDSATGSVVKQRYRTSGPAGTETVEEQFSDFRGVDGLQVAFRAVVRREGSVVIERAVTDFRVNVPIDPDVFRKPS